MSQHLTFYEHILLLPCSVSYSRGSLATSRLISSATMQQLYILSTILSSLSCLCSVLSLECNKTQYKWPVDNPQFCCNMCLPGQRMERRSTTSCDIKCVSCEEDQYSDSHNVEMNCNICSKCRKDDYMAVESACNSTHNAVCTCQAGYACKDPSCTQCVPLPTTTKPTPPPSTTGLTTEIHTTIQRPYKSVRDTVWFLVIITLLCAGIALVVMTKLKHFLQWIQSKHGYFLTEKPSPVPQCTEDEEVSKPVQEVCGKCDQPIGV